ncbi:MAG: tyrosine--tRNA ligase [Chloroflexi bacterium]|nr:tyrosine--tRNA ligase [Chloroflexota bacterium]
MNVFEELKWRGMVYDSTPDCEVMLDREKVTCYIGFDPSERSLHMGNLLAVMGLVRMQRFGHSPIAIAGGGTGMIGDPRPTAERQLLSREKVEENVETIRAQLARFLDFETEKNPARLINNADWLLELNLVEFLRDTGKQFSVNYMLDKESVKARLEREAGVSFTEFSYMLLQAYDYLELYRRYGCRLQMGGSDQWGNILAGVDLIKKVEAVSGRDGGVVGYSRGEPHALVYPLLTTASGEKFGKSEGNAIWLDRSMTSPYRCYQFWINSDDRDVVTYLRWFTLLGQDEISGLERSVKDEPAKREAQQALARAVTASVHGQSGLEEAERVTAALFKGELGQLAAGDIEDVLAGAPGVEIAKSELEDGKMHFDRFSVLAGLCTSNADARRLVDQGGAYLNDVRVKDAKQPVGVENLIEGRMIVLRRGTKTYRLVRVKA